MTRSVPISLSITGPLARSIGPGFTGAERGKALTNAGGLSGPPFGVHYIVRQEPVVAEAIGLQLPFQLLVPVLALAPLGIPVVDRLGQDLPVRPVSDHGPPVGPLGVGLMTIGCSAGQLSAR